ncbi:hypothetical protein [Fusibacter sp. JL216-2]|uniref:hypothetical protein n=1 Tax=Fusibacter sp. JL216-2 TaxID=3071453 RepID=UPI003D3407D2|tara:strand:+ start:702 stop:863 length:162 start_codon:yes stop_codon:yes gene_type:complete
MTHSKNLKYAIELALLNQLSSEGELSEVEATLVNERIHVKHGVTRRRYNRMNK